MRISGFEVERSSDHSTDFVQFVFWDSTKNKKFMFECPRGEVDDWLRILSDLHIPGIQEGHENMKNEHAETSWSSRPRSFSGNRGSSSPFRAESDSKQLSPRPKTPIDTVSDVQADFSNRKLKIVAKLAQWLTRRPEMGLLKSKGILPQQGEPRLRRNIAITSLYLASHALFLNHPSSFCFLGINRRTGTTESS